MRFRPRLDRKQAGIVEGLRKAGFSVRSLAGVGNGFPDLIVGLTIGNLLLEVEDPKRRANKSVRTRALEAGFRKDWPGPVAVVDTLEDALQAIADYQGPPYSCAT